MKFGFCQVYSLKSLDGGPALDVWRAGVMESIPARLVQRGNGVNGVNRPGRGPSSHDGAGPGDLPSIVAGSPDLAATGCVRLDPAAVLRATARSFALRVRGQSMVRADIFDGDIVVGEFTPEARPGAIVVALVDGESTLKRLASHRGQLQLVSENPNCPDPVPLTEVVIQGIVHTVIRQVR